MSEDNPSFWNLVIRNPISWTYLCIYLFIFNIYIQTRLFDGCSTICWGTGACLLYLRSLDTTFKVTSFYFPLWESFSGIFTFLLNDVDGQCLCLPLKLFRFCCKIPNFLYLTQSIKKCFLSKILPFLPLHPLCEKVLI